MTTMTGADLVAKALADIGVRHVFAIVSIHNMPLLDAINRLGKTAIVDVRHEGAGTHAADGYARATGELGVMIASTGPGTSNTVTGLYEAQYGSSRVLVITGQAETAFYGRGVGYVHEAEKQIPMLESVCRRVESPRHPSQLRWVSWTFDTATNTFEHGNLLFCLVNVTHSSAIECGFGLPSNDQHAR